MKVIDLLVKIANNEEVPKKIKWEDTIFAYSDYDKDYLEFPFSEEEYKGLFCMKDSILTQYLNDEIEIIEEKTKKIKDFEMMYPISQEFDSEIGGLVSIYNNNFAELKRKIEELTKAVNYLLEKESDK